MVRVENNDLRIAFWILVGATGLELIATLFVFTTCTLFCAREVPPEEKPEKVEGVCTSYAKRVVYAFALIYGS